MADFKTIFETYGANAESTLGRFMGNEAIYLKFLGMFFEDENFEQLQIALEKGDQKAAFEAAHTLKGVAGNLGLTPFYDAVCKVVEPLRKEADADYSTLMQEIISEYQRVKQLYHDLGEKK